MNPVSPKLRGLLLAGCLALSFISAARGEDVVAPTPMGTSPTEPPIAAPGMGWIASCALEDVTDLFTLPPTGSLPGGGPAAWKATLEVFDFFTQSWVTVPWSNYEGFSGAPLALTVFPVLGDLDGDFDADAADAARLGGHLAGNRPLPLADPGCADYNHDGVVDIRDFVLMGQSAR